jgi:riboflavin kinase / FMN adenylyltransferase
MKVYRDFEGLQRDDSTVISIGTFDGVHGAHRQILNRVIELAKKSNARSFIVTFHPHPQEVLKNKTPDIKLLSTTDEKIKLFEKIGIDNVLIITFTMEFSKTNAKDFYKDLIYSKVGISDLVVGFDHVFGRNREGDFSTLQELGKELNFKVHKVEEIDIDNIKVSSTKIRHLLAEGDIELANSLLGHEYGLEGVVVQGDKSGRTLGYPTANLEAVSVNKQIPADGVYCVRVEAGGEQFFGMMNIGYRPTLTEGINKIMEVNIFDFSRNLYGKKIYVNFLKRLRSEIKFNSKEELLIRLHQDKEESLNYLKSKKIITDKI